MRLILRLMIASSLLALAACNGSSQEQALQPTNTLMPIVSMTPRFTATPVPTRTPLPTFTLTPSITPIPPTPSDTPTPTEVPPVRGIIQSAQSAVNVRNGPGVDFSALEALPPGTGVIVLGLDQTGRWLNIRMDDGQEGWVAAALVYVEPTPTDFPTLTPTPNLTALALGTPLPTAIFGGGTITPTPPRSAVTATPVAETPTTAASEVLATAGTQVINLSSINQTATALAGGSSIATVPANGTPIGGPTGGPINGSTAIPTAGTPGSVTVRNGVDVLAYCDDRTFGSPPPTSLGAGSTIDVWWRWEATTSDLVQQHIDAVVYDVRVDGVALQDWRQYRAQIQQLAGGDYYVDWLVPAGPLAAGAHQISYHVTWTTAISDGANQFGPGTATAEQTGSCNFTVH